MQNLLIVIDLSTHDMIHIAALLKVASFTVQCTGFNKSFRTPSNYRCWSFRVLSAPSLCVSLHLLQLEAGLVYGSVSASFPAS